MGGERKPPQVLDDIVARKQDHIDLVLAQRETNQVLSGQGPAVKASCFDHVTLEHCALPEVNFDDIDLCAKFMEHTLNYPFMISSMTGGPRSAEVINMHLAEAAAELKIAMGVGSQRVALETGADGGLAKSIRRRAPKVALFANIGAVQLIGPLGINGALEAVDMLEANGLILHLNPVQELVQPGGDRDWRGILNSIEQLAKQANVPLIAKEVGFGISASVAQRILNAGVQAIDVAGCGGTNFADVELARNADIKAQHLGSALSGWGLNTVECLRQIKAANLQCDLIASGGIRHGIDAAKAIALGADIVAQAGPVLKAALESTEAVISHFDIMIEGIKAACLLTGSQSLHDLPNALVNE